MTYRKRALTALVAGALALPFLATPASAAPGDTATPPVQDITTFCTNPTSPQFTDVAATDTFALAIRCIATAGITVGGPEGKPADQYGPSLNIRRGQMATFIARLLDAADDRDRGNQIQDLPGYDGTNSFTDVPNNFIHVDNINRLADAGVVKGGVAGRPTTTYSPNELVSRAQMASFINRAAAFAMGQNPDGAGSTTGYTAGNADYFVDDENLQVHEPNINGVASRGIVIGVQPTSERRYAPTAAVTRAQMAGFIARTLSQLFDDDRIFSLLEIFTESFAAADRANVNAVNNTRDFRVDQLDPAVQYRITLVKCENVNRDSNDLVTFTRDGNFAATGNPVADITRVNGAATPAGTENTVTANPNAQGVLTFTIEGDGAECVTAVVYINGGAGKGLEDGGSSPRLEVDANGRPLEPFGISGDTTFAAPADTTAPTIVDAQVATEGAGATGTATAGDVFELTFSETVSTDGATATDNAMATDTAIASDAAFTVEDENGDTALIQCGIDAGGADNATAAECEINGAVLTVTLLENAVDTNPGTGADDGLQLTGEGLTITDIFNVVDQAGNEATLTGSTDLQIDFETA